MDRSIERGLRSIRLNGRKILVAKAEKPDILKKDGTVMLFLTKEHKAECQWGLIVNVSKECKYYSKSHIGAYIQMPFLGDGFSMLPKAWGGNAEIAIIDEGMIDQHHSELDAFVYRRK